MGFFISKASIRNVFGFEAIEAKFNDGANYIYGKNGSGKSSLTISGLWACIKGIAEQGDKFISQRFRCIGKGGASGDIKYEFTDSETGSKFEIKNHVTKASNQITFKAIEGSPLADDFLDDFFNVSLLSARNFCRLSGVDQAVALGIDTSSFDVNIKKLKEDRKIENRLLKESGTIEPVEKVEPVDIDALREKKKKIAEKLNQIYKKNRDHNNELRNEYELAKTEYNTKLHDHNEAITNMRLAYNECFDSLSKLKTHGYKGGEVQKFLETLKSFPEFKESEPVEPTYIIEMPDDSEHTTIDKEIESAYATNEEAKKYADYLIRTVAAKTRQKKIDDLNKQIEDEETARTEYITSMKFPFAGLNTDENGCLLFKDRPITEQNFSKGELEIIVAKLAASQNPLFKTRFIDEFGILDEDNQKKLVDDLIKDGFQVIVSIPGERVEHDNAIVLRDCKIADESETEERPELL